MLRIGTAALLLAGAAPAASAQDRLLDVGAVKWQRVAGGPLDTGGSYLYAAGALKKGADGITRLYEFDVFPDVAVVIEVEVDCRTLRYVWKSMGTLDRGQTAVVMKPTGDTGLKPPGADTENLRFLTRVCSGDELPPEPDPLAALRKGRS